MSEHAAARGDACRCGCCPGVHAQTPQPIENRPGLDAIGYRAGVHGEFLASLTAGLTRRDRVALGSLRTREPTDPTMALLDAWAVVCDVLTFYTERLAQESYLRTATERSSLAELGKLVAYRLSPGAAAETFLAFSMERPPVLPPPDPPDPGVAAPAVPAALTLPVGLRVQSVPGPPQQGADGTPVPALPQTFETVEQIDARPEWNALPVVQTAPHAPVFGRRDAFLAGTSLGLGRGSALLLASPDLVDDRWDLRLLTEVTEDPAAGRTHVRWEHGLGSWSPVNQPADAPQAFVLRRRLSVFGHHAPVWRTMNTEFRNGYLAQFPGATDTGEWPSFTAVRITGADTAEVDLEGAHPDIVPGSWVVVSQDTGGFYRELFEVTEVAELSLSAYAVAGRATRLSLRGEPHTFGTPRQVSVLAVADPLALTEGPDASAVDGPTVVVTGDAAEMAAGRTVVLAGHAAADGTPHSQVLTLASVSAAGAGRTALTFTEALGTPLARDGAVAFGNVARASHGESVTQLLGSGDARVPFAAYPLTQAPLTHVQAETPSGIQSTLEVRVDGVRWAELPSTFGAGPSARVFVTRTDPDGTLRVVFGDGVRGARPSTGSHNLRARYRKGIGAAGNVGAGSLSQALDRPLGLKAVTNPGAAAGGVDPESETQARAGIPLPVRTLGRAVSLLDYADFARAFTGIGKASAAVLPLVGGTAIVVTVAGPQGEAVPDLTLDRLRTALRDNGDRNTRVEVVAARGVAFRVALKVRVDRDHLADDVLAAVEVALRTAYAAQARDLGAPVHRSAVVATAAAVPGAVGIDLDRLYRGASPGLAQRLVAGPAQVAAPLPLGVELLTLSPEPFDWLEVTP